MTKITEKQLFIGGLLVKYEKGCTCYTMIKDYAKQLKEQGISIDKINSVNATLASLATKGLAIKPTDNEYDELRKHNGKLMTLYQATNELIELVNNNNEKEEN